MVPLISVIIPTRNRADLLGEALESLKRQTMKKDTFEVLIVDNGSTDDTSNIVDKYYSIFYNIRYFYESEPGLHVGRHCGMHAAKGDILVFADDDIEALPTWITSIKEAFEDSNISMVGGNNLPLFVQQPKKWIERLWELPGYGGGRSMGALSLLELPSGVREISPYYIWGCNFAIRKEVLLDAGGFHPDGMPKDLIKFRGDGETHVARFVESSGMKCIFHSGASVYHKVTPERMTYEYFRQRGFNQGVSDSYTMLRNGGGHVSERHSFPYTVAKWGLQKMRSLKERISTDKEVRIALYEMQTGHAEGYSYHQHAYKTDPEIRDWVHRVNYFN